MLTRRLNKKLSHTSPSQKGLGLIDVMVAVFILSVGLLAIAALQLITKQSNYEAIQRSHASTLAYDLLERMRLNSGFVSSTTAVASVTPLQFYVEENGTRTMSYDTPLPTTPDCTATPCTDYATLAAWDLVQWQRSLRGELETNDAGNVGGLVQPIACLTGPGPGAAGTYSGRYRLAIAWRGQTKLTSQLSQNDCGIKSGFYGANDEFRRILVVESYLAPSRF